MSLPKAPKRKAETDLSSDAKRAPPSSSPPPLIHAPPSYSASNPIDLTSNSSSNYPIPPMIGFTAANPLGLRAGASARPGMPTLISLGVPRHIASKYPPHRFHAFLRFMVIKSFLNDVDGTKCSPGELVDEVWHDVILDTQYYEKLCMIYLPRGIFHHRPHGATEQAERMVRTLMTAGVANGLFEPYTNETQKWGDVEIHVKAEPKIDSIYIKGMNGQTYTVNNCKNDTVLQLKAKIQKITGIYLDQQRLIFTGKQLEDNNKLYSYNGMQDGATIHLVMRLIGC